MPMTEPAQARPKCQACGGFLPQRAGAVMPCPRCAADARGRAASEGFFAGSTRQIEDNYPPVARNPQR